METSNVPDFRPKVDRAEVARRIAEHTAQEKAAPPVYPRLNHGFDHRWHVGLNQAPEHTSWMYEAKAAAHEVPRLALLFSWERHELPALHVQCATCAPTPEAVPDNHLTCCLGTECRKCPHLAVLDAADLGDEERDIAKAWTCVTHIIREGGDKAREGYLLTVDDRMYLSNLYRSLTEGAEADDATPTPPERADRSNDE